MGVWKECEICGDEFMPLNNVHKICEFCEEDSDELESDEDDEEWPN